MSEQYLSVLLYQGASAIGFGFLYTMGFVFLRRAASWIHVLLIAASVALVSIVVSFALFFLQGAERALQMITPGTDFFMVSGAPIIFSSILNAFILLSAAYALLVLPNLKLRTNAND